jgi:ABC-type phosphate/phosphonate transport system permease subunit
MHSMLDIVVYAAIGTVIALDLLILLVALANAEHNDWWLESLGAL